MAVGLGEAGAEIFHTELAGSLPGSLQGVCHFGDGACNADDNFIAAAGVEPEDAHTAGLGNRIGHHGGDAEKRNFDETQCAHVLQW